MICIYTSLFYRSRNMLLGTDCNGIVFSLSWAFDWLCCELASNVTATAHSGVSFHIFPLCIDWNLIYF